jgi:hypothetical protein
MAERGSYRTKFDERDESGYIRATLNETGAMVIKSIKGPLLPKYCTSEDDIIRRYGKPSSDYPEVFEALSFVKASPLWVSSALHEDCAWGGVYITSGAVTAFTGGQVNPDNFVFTAVATKQTDTLGTGNGVQTAWSGTLSQTPLKEFSVKLKRGSTYLNASDDDGDITGTDINGTGSINYTNGTISFTTNKAISSGEVLYAEFDYNKDLSSTVSHAFFSASPCTDDISLNIISLGGTKFKMTIYDKTSDAFLAEYNYSLTKEKDGFGANLYILDVFDENDYVIPKVNTAYLGITPSLSSTTAVDAGGGRRGSSPSVADRTTSWNYYKKPNKYYAKIIMDCTGDVPDVVQNVIENYQYYSFGVSFVPYGKTVAHMITHRNTTLAIDSDALALYCNWRKIYDPYNDSFAWISNVGSIGKKMAQMGDMYDGVSPAGIDENGRGGQISDWRTVEMEHDFNDTELKDLDEAQINPLVFDQSGYGLYIAGDNTLQVSASDTSYIATRRIDNYILEQVIKNVMRLREFKNNTPSSQLKAKLMVDEFLAPIVAKELITEVLVICDSSNNTASTKTQRKFILDIIKKSTVNNQKTLLRLTRVGQGAVISEVTLL